MPTKPSHPLPAQSLIESPPHRPSPVANRIASLVAAKVAASVADPVTVTVKRDDASVAAKDLVALPVTVRVGALVAVAGQAALPYTASFDAFVDAPTFAESH